MITLIAVATAVAAFEFAAVRYGADSRVDMRHANARPGSSRWL